jgi:hypothetical protein
MKENFEITVASISLNDRLRCLSEAEGNTDVSATAVGI